MKELFKHLQDFIDKNSKDFNITLEVKDWKECGEFHGDRPLPIFTLELKEKVLL